MMSHLNDARIMRDGEQSRAETYERALRDADRDMERSFHVYDALQQAAMSFPESSDTKEFDAQVRWSRRDLKHSIERRVESQRNWQGAQDSLAIREADYTAKLVAYHAEMFS